MHTSLNVHLLEIADTDQENLVTHLPNPKYVPSSYQQEA